MPDKTDADDDTDTDTPSIEERVREHIERNKDAYIKMGTVDN